ncbi:hypothetical protein SPRG_06171 [Saprolegnia parasitica CBS 223.65]|uniref:Essential protein Yae1 N-terminal domain-containing protein n=1 Tax=Saprolegnia parasitica (strain CBS 223.65) TaxID=695850 RepID=A0A067CIV7_SAPPC|nr:hypothetical protein SPRG_06171 [Saprolegnia parasitica CBS 223.65]KDO29115.1 hypothetical protein SPRG_06171 [Saprolegnia parasitica CBS 223.65]|eukprot:XP_012200281.1 hypothetical protein SPRG_06171 [Saprolegnia parasitica CBS 223.65]
MFDEDSDGMSDGGVVDDRVWMEKESLAMERRSRTVGFREGIDVGKEQTLQEGFDYGYKAGAAKGFEMGTLHGILRAFQHQFPAEHPAMATVLALAAELKASEEAAMTAGDIPAASSDQADAVLAAIPLPALALPDATNDANKE